MKKINLKYKITNYFNSLSAEIKANIEHNKNKPSTPKLNKLGRLAIIFCCAIYLLIGCFGGIKSSAAEVPPFVISSSAEIMPRVSVGTVPSDLTGYTVIVPAEWTTSAGYGNFSLDFTASYGTDSGICQTLYIGYRFDPDEDFVSVSNRVFAWYVGGSSAGGSFNPSSSEGFTLEITGGFDASNPSLIQWFAVNNATFVNNNAPEEPEPTTLTVPAGIYYLQNIYNDLRGTIEFDKPFTTSNGEEFVSIEFAGYNNNQYTQVSYYTNPVTDAGPSPSVPKPIYNGLNGFTDISDCIIFLEEDTVIEYYDELWDDTFVAVNSDTKLITLYNGAFNIGDAEGYDRGYTVGDADGYQEGYDDGRAHGMEDGFMSNFFGGIVDALDALTLFGNISMLDIIEGILGLMLCLWILKLIAGG